MPQPDISKTMLGKAVRALAKIGLDEDQPTGARVTALKAVMDMALKQEDDAPTPPRRPEEIEAELKALLKSLSLTP